MSLFYLHPDDRRWLKRWFRSNLVCFAAIIGFLGLLRLATELRPEPVNGNQPAQQAVPPEGWRRTNRGWEHTATWHLTPAAEETTRTASLPLVEPVWATVTLETVRNTSPLVIALGQITAIGAIIHLSRKRHPGGANSA